MVTIYLKSYSSRFFTWTTSTKMTKLYSKKTSDSTVTAILGGKTKLEGEEIIETSSSGTDYFAKGHLSPDAAFIYNVEQDATYYFVNVAPQVKFMGADSAVCHRLCCAVENAILPMFPSVPVFQQR